MFSKHEHSTSHTIVTQLGRVVIFLAGALLSVNFRQPKSKVQMSGSSNRRRLGDGQDVDHISHLSDAILSHILSFVPTKSAIKTCLLSKRWKYVWTQVPTLDFSETTHYWSYQSLTLEQKASFKIFVDRVLFHNDVSCVERLCFDPFPADEYLYVKSWMKALTRRTFHNVEISVCGIDNFRDSILLPDEFLSSEILVVLKLNGMFEVNLPVSWHLPSLETIHLIGLWLPDDEFLKELSLGCPVLKELLIEDCYGLTRTLYVESVTLKALEIRGTLGNAAFSPCIVIKTPNLMIFCLDEIQTKYDICDLRSLVEANFDMSGCDGEEIQILRNVCGVKTLRLTRSSQLLLKCTELPVFGNLTCLKLEDGTNAYKILKCAPKLKSLIFECANMWKWSFSPEFETVPECLSCLESAEFLQFVGLEVEMLLIAYILKNGSSLKEMKLQFTKQVKKDEVYQQLLMLPRASAACQVKISFYRW